MKVAKFVISEELLVESLSLLSGTRLIAIKSVENPWSNDYEFTVHYANLKDLNKYEAIPKINPIFEKTIADCGHIAEVKLRSWGYPKGDDEN